MLNSKEAATFTSEVIKSKLNKTVNVEQVYNIIRAAASSGSLHVYIDVPEEFIKL